MEKKEVEEQGFKSTHDLPFEIADYFAPIDDGNDWKLFRVGTCEGMRCSTESSYDILAITNNQEGNGHIIDVLEWFENSCKRDNKKLRILEVWNNKFKQKLIDKHSFIPDGEHLVKYFINPKKNKKCY